MFILSGERDKDAAGAFKRYSAYVEQNKSRFTTNVYELASSNWYFYANDHRCPQDARLVKFMMVEEEKKRKISKPLADTDRNLKGLFAGDTVHLQVRLLNTFADGVIEFVYINLKEYKMRAVDISRGHWDWRYDEFRVTSDGFMLHEIEWGQQDSNDAIWRIVAEDIKYKWVDLQDIQNNPLSRLSRT